MYKLFGMLSIWLCLGQGLWGQGMPVYDNTNFLTLGKQLVESGKQTAELLKMVEFLKQQKERLELVNGWVRELKAVEELLADHRKIFTRIEGDLQEILGSPYVTAVERDRMVSTFEGLLELAQEDLEFLSTLLLEGGFDMDDAQRTTFILDTRRRMQALDWDTQRRLSRYRDLLALRESQWLSQQRTMPY
ncbi:conjugal transfer protein [Sediminicola luteus]|nr:conjugal transfer protein [Sediminicola luteus]